MNAAHSQDSSDHQVFRFGDPILNLHLEGGNKLRFHPFHGETWHFAKILRGCWEVLQEQRHFDEFESSLLSQSRTLECSSFQSFSAGSMPMMIFDSNVFGKTRFFLAFHIGETRS